MALPLSRSQSVILKRGANIKYLPYVFTEHGAMMAANVLNSPHAVRMSVFVVRAFIRLRHTVAFHKEIMIKLDELERKFTAHDSDIKRLFVTVRQLMAPPEPKTRKMAFWLEKGRRKSRRKRLNPEHDKINKMNDADARCRRSLLRQSSISFALFSFFSLFEIGINNRRLLN
jgi:hypothetical protein